MNSYIENIINKHIKKGIIIDSNLLLLYFIGLYDVEWIEKFKRTKQYVKDDFENLARLLNLFENKYTTPHILTEVINLSNSLPKTNAKNFCISFAKSINIFIEEYIEAKQLCKESYFMNYGLTDTMIIKICKRNLLVLTDDLRLAAYLERNNVSVLNFNHMRLNWLI